MPWRARVRQKWVLGVGCWMLDVLIILSFVTPFTLHAQLPPQVPAGAQAQLQVQQPLVDVSSPVTAVAEFDPPVTRPGEKVFYRITLDSTESAVQFPGELPAPAELHFGAHAGGQMTPLQGNKFRPLAQFVYEVQAASPGKFTVSNFTVNVSGQPIQVPAASLNVISENAARSGGGLPAGIAAQLAGNFAGPARKLALELSATNVFVGQPFHARVLLPAGPGNQVEALREIELTGDGLMSDKTALKQSIEPANLSGELKPAFICEMTVTPIAPGALKFFAQGFSAGREFSGPISIRGALSLPGGPTKYALLISDPVEIRARPLPVGELPGFTGTIGKYFFDPVQLPTNRLHVGEPVALKINFHGEGDLTRLVPPEAPRSRDWQIIADPPPATSFTLIPETDDVTNTPAIPFSYFDPASGKYVDLTIPPLPVTVVGEGLPVEVRELEEADKEAAPVKLSGLAPTPGKTAASLQPPQLSARWACAQLAPVIGFLAMWQWDRRRRFLEAHPEIVRRRRALRALRRERREMRKAGAGGNSEEFLAHAVAALRAGCAPHYPAQPEALVCADVLAQLGPTDETETVRRIFATADARFAATSREAVSVLELNASLERLLQTLEARL